MGAQWKAKVREVNANAKGRLFTKISKEIAVAARSGADPDSNSRLRLLVEQARKASMPRETLERALKRGADKNSADNLQALTYEGFAPHRVPIIVECLSDNVNRTISEIRVLFRKGQLGNSGAVSWDFDHLGMVEATPAKAGADPEEAAIEAGARDFEPGEEDGATLFLTEPTDLDLVTKALPQYGFTVTAAKIGWVPKNPVALSGSALEEVETFLANIDANDDVQNIYVGLKAE